MKQNNKLIQLLADDNPVGTIAIQLQVSENYIHQKLHRMRKAANVRTNWGLVSKGIRDGVVS